MQTGFGITARTDAWWLRPLVILVVLSSFIVYATWAAFQGDHYSVGPYLSPFYSPVLFGDSPHAWFGPKPHWWPLALPFSPALLILWAPGGFRLYRGENSLPLILQNAHRFFLYLALIFVFILLYDAWNAMWFVDPSTGEKIFGVGVGTLVLFANSLLLGIYTFSCHSFRHLVGGFRDRLSKAPVQKTVYLCASCLNRRHMNWAWFSLFSVAFADIYVRLVSMGIWTDYRIL